MDLTPLRREIDLFLRQLAEEEYRQQAGLKSESQLAGIYEHHQSLFRPSRIEEVRAALSGGGVGNGTRFLLEFLTHTALEAEVQAVTDRVLSQEASAVIEADGRSIPLRGADVVIRDEADRPRRAHLDRARAQAIDRLNPLLRERLAHFLEAVARHGAINYAALWEQLSGIHLDGLEKLVHDLLAQTGEMYTDVLKWMLRRKLGVPSSEAARHDLARLFRAPEYDRLLPPGAAAAAFEEAARRMGIDQSAGGRIQIDAEVRPTKTSRAFVAAIDVPERVVLVIRPSGGWADLESHLHELGHALHFAYTDPALPVEFRRLGDASLAEAHAFLMEGLLLEPGFVRRFLAIPRERDFLRLVALHKLYLLRRHAAKFLYERCLYGGAPDGKAAETYRDLVARATAAEFPPEQYLYDVDPSFYVARYLRAWIFEAQLREQLCERFDEEWYRNDRTGPFLLALWRQGQAVTPEGLGAQLGMGPLRTDALIRSVTRHLA